MDPSWLPVVGVFVPIAGIAGGLIGARWARKGAREADDRGRREELMRQQRWASELAVSDDPRKARLGVAQLEALLSSVLISAAEKAFIDASLEVMLDDPRQVIESSMVVNEDVDVWLTESEEPNEDDLEGQESGVDRG